MRIEKNARYHSSHEWVCMDGDSVLIGISDFGQDALGEIVYVELPEVSKVCMQGETVGVIESVKAASDFYAPLAGKIIEVNERLRDQPELINQEPYEDGWIMRIEPSEPKQLAFLMEPDQYEEYARTQDGF